MTTNTTTFGAAITNLAEYNNGNLIYKWLEFPCTEDDFTAALKAIGNPEEYFISDYDDDTHLGVAQILGEYPSYQDMQGLAEVLEDMDRDTLEAINEVWGWTEVKNVLNGTCDIDDYQLLSDVNDQADLGDYYAEELGIYESMPETVRRYFNAEAFGRDIDLETCGGFTTHGYIIYQR
jgi:antirestriction protein